MEEIIFNFPINISCKVGDTVLFSPTGSQGGFTVAGNYSIIGLVDSIVSPNPNPVTYNDIEYAAGTVVIVTVDTSGFEDNFAQMTTNDFVFFAKNNLIEVNAITGYFAKAKFQNNSTSPAELFATACGVEDSSE